MVDQLDRLLEEIDFWQMVVDGYHGRKKTLEYDRMNLALKLAEYRFSVASSASACSQAQQF